MNLDKVPKIRVLVRKRPLNKKQKQKNQEDIIAVQNNQTVLVREQKFKVDMTPFIDEYIFNFDGAYNQFATNQQIYLTAVKNLVDCAFDGARVSCFAYGQTGSGKTHTMLGNGYDVKGLYLLAAEDIFQIVKNYGHLSVWISFYQIYCGKLYDLLNERNILHAREDAKNNVNIVGLSERKISNVNNLIEIIQFGTGIRVTAQNGTNVDSSRSHAILQINLKHGNKLNGKISFIDLAGSERAADHADQLEKQTRIDGAEINKSLLALKQCIRALDHNKNHTPFRGSKLTMVLKDSFTGYCRTVMIGNISPNSSSCENTLNTLKYADRVKQLKKPSKDRMMELDYLDELSRELMLPRQNVNHKNHSMRAEEFNGVVPNLKKNNFLDSVVEVPNQLIGNYQSHNPNSKYESMKVPVQNKNMRKKSGDHIYQIQKSSPIRVQRLSVPSNIINKNVSNLVQQPSPNKRVEHIEESFEQLARKHQNCIQTIIEEEQELMKCHERHINLSIELVKKQMHLMSEADKIGSDIETYLNSLESVLNSEMESIMSVREKVFTMKRNLKESKYIEKLYIEQSKLQNKGYFDEDANLLEDDDNHLFH